MIFQRARLVLAAKGVKYNCINIDLNNKPDWFFDLNPYGEVPVVIHNGNHVYESLISAGNNMRILFSGSTLIYTSAGYRQEVTDR